jgi:hypothetical protein
MDTPRSHHGIFLPERKKSAVLLPAFREAKKPSESNIRKKTPRIIQSRS